MNATFQINGLVIETERLILRPFEAADLNDFYEYASVEGVGEMAGWRHHESIAKSQEILDTFIKEDKTFAIILKENNKVIGSLGVEKYGMEHALTEFDGYQGREIGYVLTNSARDALAKSTSVSRASKSAIFFMPTTSYLAIGCRRVKSM